MQHKTIQKKYAVSIKIKWACNTIFCSVAAFVLLSAHTVSATDIHNSMAQTLLHHVTELQGQEWYIDAVSPEEQWLFDVYQDVAFSPLWTSSKGLNSKGEALFAKLLRVEEHGLRPEAYKVPRIQQLLDAKDWKQLALLDVLLTDGILRFIHDITKGRSQAQQAFPRLFPEAGKTEFQPSCIFDALHSAALWKEYLDGLGPQHAAYKHLQKSLADYRLLAKEGGWPAIAQGNTLYPGEKDLRIPAIQQLLRGVWDLDAVDEGNNIFDELTVQAVRQFQRRHGLKVDGIVGNETVAAMNVSVDERIQQVELNLERWRWHDQFLGRKYVFVNIAGFHLKVVVDDEVLLEMPIIVGTLHHESPLFSDRIRYIEFNPFWNIPTSIARNETLKNLRDDPNYLTLQHIRFFSSWQNDAVELDPMAIDWHQVSRKTMGRFKFRQDPGSWNALGTMKFVFPNRYSVYLHDTPNHELFKTSQRAYSHGCIRLSDPEALAVFLMGGESNKWSRQRVKKIVASGKRTVIRLPERVPVHLTYMTSWHDTDGLLFFNKDIYQRDKRLQIALENR